MQQGQRIVPGFGAGRGFQLQQPSKSRREYDQARSERVVVALDNRVVFNYLANHLHLGDQEGLARVGGLVLGIGVEGDPDDRSNVNTHLLGRLAVHHGLICAVLVRQPTLDEAYSIHGGVLAVRAADQRRGCLAGRKVRMKSSHRVQVDVAVEDDRGGGALNQGKVCDRFGKPRIVSSRETEARVVIATEEPDRGRIGADEVHGEGGLGAPRPATAPIARPPISPMSSTMLRYPPQRYPKVARKRYQATRRTWLMSPITSEDL